MSRPYPGRRFGVGGWLLPAVLAMPAPLFAESAATRLTINDRLTKLEQMLDSSNMTEIFMQLDTLRQEVETLRGDIEVMSHDLESMKRQQKDLYLDLDNRMQQLQSARPAPGAPGNGGPSPLGMPGDELGTADMEQQQVGEETAYRQAFARVKDRQYKEAVLAFKTFLISYPSGQYAANAQYWLGEVHYALREFAAAAEAFGQVVEKFPDSAKVADAQLKKGFSYYELEQWAKARESLELVRKNYPGTAAARLAERRLQQMKAENRG